MLTRQGCYLDESLGGAAVIVRNAPRDCDDDYDYDYDYDNDNDNDNEPCLGGRLEAIRAKQQPASDLGSAVKPRNRHPGAGPERGAALVSGQPSALTCAGTQRDGMLAPL